MALKNCVNRVLSLMDSSKGLPMAASRSTPEWRSPLIGGAHFQIRLERDHAGGEARENDGESRSLGLHRLLTAARLLAALPRRLVMSLKESRETSSSRPGSGNRVS